MNCQKCGAGLTPGTKFCAACGSPVEAAATQPVALPRTGGRPGGDTAPPPDAEPRRRSGLVIGIVAAVLAVAVAGAAGAFLLRGGDSSAAGTSTSSATAPASAKSPAAGASTVAPAGASPGSTTSSTAAEPTSTSATPTAPTTLPDLKGKSVEEAQALLPGVTITQQQQLVEDGDTGTIVAQQPKAGEPTGSTVTVTVTEQAVTTYLADVQAVSGEIDSGVQTMAGKQYPHAVSWFLRWGTDSGDVAYDLGTHYRRLKATVGQDDQSPTSTTTGLVEVFGDGKKLWSQTIGFGKPVQLDLDVTKVLRLELRVSKSSFGDDDRATYVLGDARFLGLSGEVPSPTSTD